MKSKCQEITLKSLYSYACNGPDITKIIGFHAVSNYCILFLFCWGVYGDITFIYVIASICFCTCILTILHLYLMQQTYTQFKEFMNVKYLLEISANLSKKVIIVVTHLTYICLIVFFTYFKHS